MITLKMHSTTLESLCTACLVMLLILSSAHAQQQIDVTERDGLLSVQATNTSAAELAQVLTEQLGINVVVTGDTETLVNIDIVEEPLAKALTKLSPNNMLVRSDADPDSEIIEVVLIMGEGSGSQSGSSDQFLPSGAPADGVGGEEAGQQATDGGPLRDPNRIQQAREAAGAAASDAAGLGGLPRPADLPNAQAVDPTTGQPLDPQTGQPIQQ